MTNVLRFSPRVLSLTLLGVTATLVPFSAADSKQQPDRADSAFSFALVGDVPYGGTEVPAFDEVIEEVNRDASIRFVMHAGDVKGGSERCDDDLLRSRFEQYQKFGVTPQSSFAGFAPYVENVVFIRHRVVFAPVHVVGSHNDLAPWTGFDPSDSPSTPRADRIAEFNARLGAALTWLDETFRHATEINAAGVLILIQANPLFELPGSDPQRAGFNAFPDRLKTHVAAFGRPVVLAHGDLHELLIDKPFNRSAQRPRLPYFTRIQTFGSPSVHWIKVTVDPKSFSVFTFEERIVHQNTD